jgi:hypothetical protein
VQNGDDGKICEGCVGLDMGVWVNVTWHGLKKFVICGLMLNCADMAACVYTCVCTYSRAHGCAHYSCRGLSVAWT